MDANLKAKWIEALRSGEYPQSRLGLRNAEGFCCLGVLCDVMGADWKSDGEVVVCGIRQAGYLDDVLLKTVGFSEETQEHLYNMNDGGMPFSKIADHIEANL